VHKAVGDRLFREHRPAFDAAGGDEMHLIVLAAEHAGAGRHVVGDDPVAALALQFGARVIEQLFGFGGKADDEARAFLAMGQRRENIGILHE
jgi:hypothetical protein